MKLIVRLLPPGLKARSILLFVIAAAGAYLASLVPIYLGRTLDEFTAAGVTLYSIGAFSAMFLLSGVLDIYRRAAVDRLGARFQENLLNESLQKLIFLPLKDLEANGASGELTSKANQAVTGAAELLKLAINSVLPSAFTSLFVIVQCLGQAPPGLSAVMLGYVLCTVTVSLIQIKSQRGIREDVLRKKVKLDGEVCQSIVGIEQIRALHAEGSEKARLNPLIKGIRLTECRHHTVMSNFDTVKHILKALFFAGIFLACLYMTRQEAMTAGVVLTVSLLFQQLQRPLDEFYRFLDEISMCSVKTVMLDEIMGLDNDWVFGVRDAHMPEADGGIKISNSKVYSPDGTSVVSQYGGNITFKTGQSTALVADTGKGKTSLLKAIMRIYPMTGTVTVFGADLRKISQKMMTELIHYLPQTPFFFTGSVRDNIIYGLEKIPDDSELLEALKKACIYNELVKKDSRPLDIALQENGKNFSGGQLKRLALTRAFLRKPKMFLLDEATANLDEKTADIVLSNVEAHAAKCGAGIVHVTHESQVIKRCSATVDLCAAIPQLEGSA